MTLLKHPIVQQAYVVADMDAACHHWTALLGAGPFFVSRHHRSEDVSYRGAPSDPDLSYGFGYAGSTQIQLIEQHDDTPSCYRDMYRKGEQGFHHVAILVPDFNAEKQRFEAAGFPAVTELVSAARVAYMDTRSVLGCFVELYEDNPGVRASFANWQAAHAAWDGRTDPLREL